MPKPTGRSACRQWSGRPSRGYAPRLRTPSLPAARGAPSGRRAKGRRGNYQAGRTAWTGLPFEAGLGRGQGSEMLPTLKSGLGRRRHLPTQQTVPTQGIRTMNPLCREVSGNAGWRSRMAVLDGGPRWRSTTQVRSRTYRAQVDHESLTERALRTTLHIWNGVFHMWNGKSAAGTTPARQDIRRQDVIPRPSWPVQSHVGHLVIDPCHLSRAHSC